jgi:tetratricopeptide (TPR) repeat protein
MGLSFFRDGAQIRTPPGKMGVPRITCAGLCVLLSLVRRSGAFSPVQACFQDTSSDARRPVDDASSTTRLASTAEQSAAATNVYESVEACLQKAQEVHDDECRQGFRAFGRSDTSMQSEWTDDDKFTSFSVGTGNAGPDESNLTNGDVIFQSKEPLFDPATCQALIAEARDAITNGLKEDGQTIVNDPTNSQLGEARVSSLPSGKQWLTEELRGKLFPLLESRFGISATNLTLNDALIIGYGYFGGPSRSQPLHRDASILSLNIALSPQSDYEGGGTYFQGIDSILQQEQGHVLCHSGGAMHAGNAISSGERWVMVLFVISEDVPQLSRRCHALGLGEMDKGDHAQARNIFQAGLSVAPNDHLVHVDLGRTFLQDGLQGKARQCLAESINAYSLDGKAPVGLAKMLQESGRPRAALRRLDAFLEQNNDADLKPGAWITLRSLVWDARVTAVSCALQCANKSKPFAEKHLQTAIERLYVSLEISPGNPQLMGMMNFAKKLEGDYGL